MEKLVFVLQWFVNNKINIEHVSFDGIKNSVLIMWNNSSKMLEIAEKDIIYYNTDIVKRFSNILTEEIIDLLDNKI